MRRAILLAFLPTTLLAHAHEAPHVHWEQVALWTILATAALAGARRISRRNDDAHRAAGEERH